MDNPQKRSTGQWILQGFVVEPGGWHFKPPTDVIELEDRLVILVEIAGMDAESFNIVTHNRDLVISGTRRRTALENPAFHQAEIGFGAFRLQVQLPWRADPQTISAQYDNGFLRIDLPRQTERQILITDNPSGD